MRRLLALTLTLLLALSPLSALSESDSIATLETLMDFIQRTLDSKDGLLYERDAETYYFTLLYEAEDDRLGEIFAYLDVYPSGILVQASYYADVPLERVDETAKFMNLVNADLLGGKYFIYAETGTIFYEVFLYRDFFDLNALGAKEQNILLDFLSFVVTELDYDTEYFAEIISGETAENAYAMYIADMDRLD